MVSLSCLNLQLVNDMLTTQPCVSPCRLKKPKRHVTTDWEFEVGHAKTVHNPLHNMAVDAFPTLEKTIEENSVPGVLKVYPNAGANATVPDIDSLSWPKLEDFDFGPPGMY